MESDAKFQALVEQSLVGIYIIEGGGLRYVNPGFAHMFGFDSADEMIGAVAVADLVAPEDRERVFDSLVNTELEGGEMRFRFSGIRRDGHRFHVEIFGRRWDQESKPAVIGILIDVTDLCRAEEKLSRQAYYDGLTNLPNRILFFDRLNQALALARREDNLLALLFLDLDGFKAANDRFGHAIGDQVLVAVAGRFVSALRASDTLARLGGDEFGIIATGLTFGDDVIPVAEKLIASLAAPIVVAGHSIQLGVSIGIALFPHHAANSDCLYRVADQAMYTAKEHHRGSYCFYEGEAKPEGDCA